MFLKQFKYLIAVAEERHFGRAAERCHVTQPSLSTGIKLLELEIGAPIFLRGRGQRFRGLTPEGEKVARWARSVVANCEAMREEIDSMSNNLRGRLRIGAMPSMSPVLPLLLQRVRQHHPGIVIDVRFIGNESMRLGLNEFSLDVAFTYLEASDMGRRNTLPVYSEKLSLLVPDTDEFRGRDTITWQDAAKLPLAMLRPKLRERAFVDSMFERAGCTPSPKIESESILHLMFQVQYTELCTIIPSHFTKMPGLHTGTRALELVEPVASQDVALFWAEGETIMPMAKALVAVIRKMNKSGEFSFELSDKPPRGTSSPDNPLASQKSVAKTSESVKADVSSGGHARNERKPAKRPKATTPIKPAKRADKDSLEVVST
jgi:DNA-binding transcriptional LysR family regulator